MEDSRGLQSMVSLIRELGHVVAEESLPQRLNSVPMLLRDVKIYREPPWIEVHGCFPLSLRDILLVAGP
jgi:hypothetical protein